LYTGIGFAFAIVPGDQHIQTQTKFSVIIPARNEEENIQNCLRSILEQDYPAELFEVIVINDHSTDGTEDIIRLMQHDMPTSGYLISRITWMENN
jgi:glycosyltransferase involved in cell wall biosynthesis